MAEYIEKQAARDAIKREWDGVGGQYEAWAIIKDTCDAIDEVPPADVRPVVRGRWVKVGGFVTPGGDPVWECSECGKGRHVYGIEHGTYGADVSDGQWVSCPNCGADMKEAKPNDKKRNIIV